MTTAEPAARRGRPTVVDREKVAAAALTLWHANGFEATRWEDLAAATGISARTLVRRFGSQTAVLDVSIDQAVAELESILAADPTGDISLALADAITQVVGVHEGGVGPGVWASVIAREPALQAWLRTGYQPWIDAIAMAIRARRPDIDESSSLTIAAAFEAATSAALLQWASRGAEGSPTEEVRRALGWISVRPAEGTA